MSANFMTDISVFNVVHGLCIHCLPVFSKTVQGDSALQDFSFVDDVRTLPSDIDSIFRRNFL